MTHDPRDLQEACSKLIDSDLRCRWCGRQRYVFGETKSFTMPEIAAFHDYDCPLRIVIEAALANTESIPKWLTELQRQWPKIIAGTEHMICWTGELEAYTPAGSDAVKEIIDGCFAARSVEDCRESLANTESGDS